MKRPTRKSQPNTYATIGSDKTKVTFTLHGTIFIPAPVTYWNTNQFARCAEGSTGSMVVQPAHTYSSAVSQQDANAQALLAATARLVCVPNPVLRAEMTKIYSTPVALVNDTTLNSDWFATNGIYSWVTGYPHTIYIVNSSTGPIDVTGINYDFEGVGLLPGGPPAGWLGTFLHPEGADITLPLTLTPSYGMDSANYFIITLDSTAESAPGQRNTLYISHTGYNSPFVIGLEYPS